jgi:ectoine hydroxylase-related dioxygenase (phytanoyl-CoA dioxygenase family)
MAHVVKPERTLLSDEEIERYRAEGFLLLDRPLVPLSALNDIKVLLDRLFERFDRLPTEFAKDLAEDARTSDKPRVPEITMTTRLSPQLLRTPAAAICTSIARQLHGPNAHLVFDHAIYKPVGHSAATPWHQDAAYAKPGELSVGIWLPLQDVAADEGCMRFVPGSHIAGLLEHRHLASESNPGLLGANVEEDKVVSCPVRAGGLVVHNVMTAHSTGPNGGSTTRRVWIMNFSTADWAPPVVPPATKVEVLRAAVWRYRLMHRHGRSSA